MGAPTRPDNSVGISVFISVFANDRTQASCAFQAQIAMAPFGWHRGSFGGYANVFVLFLSSNVPDR